jgi:CheY-like chemotaxis protein
MSNRRRILVVDDHVDSCDLMRTMLELDGHEVVTTTSGQEALRLLRDRTFDVALLDLGVPEVDGYALARFVRSTLGAEAPLLVALTGHARAADHEASRRAGFDVHLPKPVDRTLVRSVIARSREE